MITIPPIFGSSLQKIGAGTLGYHNHLSFIYYLSDSDGGHQSDIFLTLKKQCLTVILNGEFLMTPFHQVAVASYGP